VNGSSHRHQQVTSPPHIIQHVVGVVRDVVGSLRKSEAAGARDSTPTARTVLGDIHPQLMSGRSMRDVAGASLILPCVALSPPPLPRLPEDLTQSRGIPRGSPHGPLRPPARRKGQADSRKGTPGGGLIHFRTPRETVRGSRKRVRTSPRHSTVVLRSISTRRRGQRTARCRKRVCPQSPRTCPMSRGNAGNPGESSGVIGNLSEVRFGC